jgi:hypothetical protein
VAVALEAKRHDHGENFLQGILHHHHHHHQKAHRICYDRALHKESDKEDAALLHHIILRQDHNGFDNFHTWCY